MKDNKLYILVRNDIKSMSRDTADSQIVKATCSFFNKYGKKKNVIAWKNKKEYETDKVSVLHVTETQLFGIVEKFLSYSGICILNYDIRVSEEIAKLLRQNYDARYCSYKVIYDIPNTDMVTVTRRIVTCGYVFGSEEKIKSFLESYL